MKYYIITYGCQMNESDSERIATVLEDSGMSSAKSEDRADFIIINMCSVRQKSVDKIFRKISIIRTKNKKLSRSYYKTARNIGMKTRIHLPKYKKIYFCKYCDYPFSAKTVRIRFNNKKRMIKYYCKECGQITRRGY